MLVGITHHVENKEDLNENLIEYGVLDLCPVAMKKFDANAALLNSARTLFGSLMNNESLAEQVSGKGGLKALVSVMKGHLEDSGVKEIVCCAITSFVKAAPDKSDKVVDTEETEAVVGAMIRHPDSEEVQLDGCNALRAWARINDARRRRVLQAKGWAALSAAAALHDDENEELSEAAAELARVLFSRLCDN